MPTTAELWAFFPYGLLLSIAIETPVLLAGLSGGHSIKRRLFAGVWLTACTYPIVVLVLPIVVWEPFGRLPYLIVAETFAPVAECSLFYFAFKHHEAWRNSRLLLYDFAVIIAANLTSFLGYQFAREFL